MNADELGAVLETIADKAPALRKAGVVGLVTIDGVSFEVGVVEAAVATPQQTDETLGNAIDDGDTYGGFIPQRRVAPAYIPPSPAEDGDDD